MAEKRKQTEERRSLFKDLQFWTLFFVFIGGIFNYIFVTRLSTQLANTEKQIKMTLDITSFIKDIQPNLQVKAERWEFDDPYTIFMYFDINNIGTHVVVVEEPVLRLGSGPIANPDDTSNHLIENTHYKLINMRIGNVPPGQKVQHVFKVRFTSIPNIQDVNGAIFYHTDFSTKTDWAVTKIAKEVLADFLTHEDVQCLSARSYSVSGQLKYGKKPQGSE